VFDRGDNSPYAQASWYFRPYIVGHSADGSSESSESQPITWNDSNVVVSKDPQTIPPGNITPSTFTNVYALILNLPNNVADSALSSGKVKVRTVKCRKRTDITDQITPIPFSDLYYVYENVEKNIDYIGAIVLSSDNSSKTIAFFNNKYWNREYIGPDPTDTFKPESATSLAIFTTYTDSRDCFMACTDSTFNLYNALKTDSKHRLYLYDLQVDSGSNNYVNAEYVFNFSINYGNSSVDGNYYVKFISYNTASVPSVSLDENDEEYGTWAEFMHYSPLV
jgi:hypothetical protein